MVASWRSRPFALDPTKRFWPQIASAIGQFFIILGGPALGLVAIDYYPFLIQQRTIYIGGITSIILWFIASFAFFGNKSFPRAMPRQLRLVFRVGYALCTSFLLLGLVGIANGYDTPLVNRDVPVVAKHTTRHSDPARRTYYLALRPWPTSGTVVELAAPRNVYDRVAVPIIAIGTPQQELATMRDIGVVQLVVGEGRFGLEWLSRIRLPEHHT